LLFLLICSFIIFCFGSLCQLAANGCDKKRNNDRKLCLFIAC
ncbi:MAG: hypothetical protein ACI9AB_002043, partial [Urechidicola sp.]